MGSGVRGRRVWRSQCERGGQDPLLFRAGISDRDRDSVCLSAILPLELSRNHLSLRESRSARKGPSIRSSLQVLRPCLGLTVEARHAPHTGSLRFSRAAGRSCLTSVNRPLTVNSLVTNAARTRSLDLRGIPTARNMTIYSPHTYRKTLRAPIPNGSGRTVWTQEKICSAPASGKGKA
jgi:hypothetical protein